MIDSKKRGAGKVLPPPPFKFALATRPVQAKAAPCGACGPAVKVPPAFKAGMPEAAPVQAKAVHRAPLGAQTIQRMEVIPPSFAELQVLHQKWDRDYARSNRPGKDPGDGDDDGGGGKKTPGFTFAKGATKGTCYSGRDCSGGVVSNPHHKHNCCGGRGSSGSSYRDYTGACSNC